MKKLLTLLVLMVIVQTSVLGQEKEDMNILLQITCKVFLRPEDCFPKDARKDCYYVWVEMKDGYGRVTEFSQLFMKPYHVGRR